LGRFSRDFGREHLRSLGRCLRDLREARSCSLKRLSSESGVSVAAIQKIESGETNPNLLTVLAIADVLGESVDRLVMLSRNASQISRVQRGIRGSSRTSWLGRMPRMRRMEWRRPTSTTSANSRQAT
jgi:transcriptional regulator with XRE-family HTH domain